MFKNYFFLNRFIIEANKELSGSILTSIFTQEKNKLILRFNSDNGDKNLEISVNPVFPYLNLRNNYQRAKKNTIDFYDDATAILPSSLIDFSIAESDRIIKINTQRLIIYFAVRGKHTNVFFVEDLAGIQSFKKDDELNANDFLNEVSHLYFLNSYNHLNLEGKKYNSWIDLRKDVPVIGKEIIAEAQFRSSDQDVPDISILHKIISEINEQNAAVFIDENASDIRIAVESFNIFPFTSKEIFDSYISALNYFYSKYYQLESSDDKKKVIKKHLDRALIKLTTKLNDIKTRLDAGTREDEYKRTGELLLINRHMLKKGLSHIEVPDIYNDNNPLVIKLKETLSPQENIDYYFDKSRSEKINYNKSKELYNSLLSEFDKLKQTENRFNNIEKDSELISIMKELKIKTIEQSISPKDELKDKFKQYIIYNKYSVYVGKDSNNNDLLTTKFAKQNDYWFHARSVPGSHVVLRVDNTKEPVPKDVLKKAAALAAYHSKAKTSGMAPVSYSFKKYVVKKKGMEPGKVALLKEDVLIVKPEIPDGVEYVSND